jgi:hypothetical protein
MDLFNFITDPNTLMGGPSLAKTCCTTGKTVENNTQLELFNVDMDVKGMAYDVFVKNTGYTLFDLTKITALNTNNNITIVNNTSFYVFMTIFLVMALILIVFMVTGVLNVIVGLHLLLLLSIIIYVLSILYRLNTIQSIGSASVDAAITRNRALYEQSIALLPNSINNINKVVGN